MFFSQVPMFLQTHARGRRLYSGLAEFPGFRTSFEMVELKTAPHQYTHLAGLLDVFKTKIVSRCIIGCGLIWKKLIQPLFKFYDRHYNIWRYLCVTLNCVCWMTGCSRKCPSSYLRSRASYVCVAWLDAILVVSAASRWAMFSLSKYTLFTLLVSHFWSLQKSPGE